MSTRLRHFICVRCAVILRYTDSVDVNSLVTCLTLSVNHVYKLLRTTTITSQATELNLIRQVAGTVSRTRRRRS